MSDRGSSLLQQLERCKASYGGVGPRKLALLRELEASWLRRPRQVRRLHELLCFLRAYPDDARVLAQVERMLSGFEARRDLKKHRADLADTGIAGTVIRFRFFAPTALWLARRWPDRLAGDWRGAAHRAPLATLLPLLALYAESLGLDELPLPARHWLARMRGPGETDASFLVRRFAALPAGSELKEAIYDELDIPMV